MKKIMVAIIAVCAMVGMARAAIEKVGDVTWWYRACDGGVEIYSGNGAAVSTDISGAVTVPSYLGGKPVVAIGDYAFNSCWQMTSCTVPNSVTRIGESAFVGCENLISISLPAVTEIGMSAFYGCWNLNSVTLSSSISSVGSGTFDGTQISDGFADNALMILDGKVCLGYKGTCPKSLTIPSGVRVIADDAFSGCRTLESVSLPDGLVTIGDYAFSGTAVMSITIPSTVTRIGNSAFYNCGGITSLTLPEGVLQIGDSAFKRCEALASIEIPASVTNIAEHVFQNCTSLMTVKFCGNKNPTSWTSGMWPSAGSLYAGTPETLTTYVPYGSIGWHNDGSARLPDSWCDRAIEHYGTPIMRTVTFDANGGAVMPTSVEFIDGESVDVPRPTREGPYSFGGWYDAREGGSRIAGSGEVYLGGDATLFAHWSYNGSGNEPMYAYDSATGYVWSFEEWNDGEARIIGVDGALPGVLRIPATLTDNATKKKYAVTALGDNVFNGMSQVTSIVMPSAVSSIGSGAFSGTGIKTFTVPESVMNFDLSAFSDCPQLETLTVLTYCFRDIDEIRLENCQKLKTLVLPSYVTNENGDFVSDDNWYHWYDYGWDGMTMRLWDLPALDSLNVPENVVGCSIVACQRLSAINFPSTLREMGFYSGLWNLDKVVFSGPVPDCPYDYNWGWLDLFSYANSVYYPAEHADLWKKVLRNSGYGGTHGMYVRSASAVMAEMVSNAPRYAVTAVPDFGPFVVGVAAEQTMASAEGYVMTGAPTGLLWSSASGTLQGSARQAGTFEVTLEKGGEVQKMTVRVDPVGPGNELTINFDANGGAVSPDSRTVASGAAVGDLPKPVRAGYVFAGWWTAAEGGGKVNASYVVDSSVTFYAHWILDANIVIDTEESYDTKSDGSFELSLLDVVYSGSAPRFTVKGLPAGLKFDAKTGVVSGKATKPGTYKVSVSATNATVKKPVTAEFEIVVPNLASEKLPGLEQDTKAYGAVMCGVALPTDLVDCTPEDGWTVKAAGLPAGLKFTAKDVVDPKTKQVTAPANTIYGVPTKAGTFTVTFTATKRGEPNQVATITLRVEALPAWAQGSFTGYVAGDGGDHGFATMTVTANGRISGKVALGGTNWTFSATSYDATSVMDSGDDGACVFVVKSEAKAGKVVKPIVLEVRCGGEVESLANGVAEGVFCDGEVKMRRGMWKDKATAAAAKATIEKFIGVYTVSVANGADYGSGYLSLTVGKDGSVRATGKLADGTGVTATSPLMYDADAGWFVLLYVAPPAYKGGSFAAAVGFGDRLSPVLFTPQWTSRNPQASGEYGEGFERDVDLVGAYYNKLDTLHKYYDSLRLELNGSPELGFILKETSLNEQGRKVTTSSASTASAIDTFWQSGFVAAVNEKGAIVVEKATRPVQDKETKEWSYEGANDGALTLSFTQATGIFRGSYTFWYDYVSAYDETTDKETMAHASKKASFEGILVQGEDPKMDGFYPWDASSEYEDEKTGKVKTYKYKQSFPVLLLRDDE